MKIGNQNEKANFVQAMLETLSKNLTPLYKIAQLESITGSRSGLL